MGLLLTKFTQEKTLINMNRALSCPLCPIPLALATSGGQQRRTCKNALFEATLSEAVGESSGARRIEACGMCILEAGL